MDKFEHFCSVFSLTIFPEFSNASTAHENEALNQIPQKTSKLFCWLSKISIEGIFIRNKCHVLLGCCIREIIPRTKYIVASGKEATNIGIIN